jgi:hypothetical protein
VIPKLVARKKEHSGGNVGPTRRLYLAGVRRALTIAFAGWRRQSRIDGSEPAECVGERFRSNISYYGRMAWRSNCKPEDVGLAGADLRTITKNRAVIWSAQTTSLAAGGFVVVDMSFESSGVVEAGERPHRRREIGAATS